MVKGCQRRMVCLKQTGSEWFEEAYFLLREEKQEAVCDEDSLLREADRIVTEQCAGTVVPRGLCGRQKVFWSLIGAAVAFSLCAILLCF